jgi:pyroglutamyl-peptidase
MKKILLTSFVPFGGITTNSSQEVLKRMEVKSNDVEIIKETLDVSYENTPKQIDKLLERYKPDVLLLCGQAGNTEEIRLELVGINLALTKAEDNMGIVRYNEPIHQDGDNAYFSTVDFVSVYDSLSFATLPLKLSLSAGGYLCNMALYHALYHVQKEHLPVKVGFIHFPYFKNQMSEAKSLDLEVMVSTLEALIREIAKR